VALPGPDANGPALSVDHLSKRFGDRVAFSDVSFEVARGEVFGFLGPNGAGKTTTVLMLLGLTERSEGVVRVVGVDPMRDPLAVKRKVGYMPDTVGFYDGMTGRQNLAYTGRLNRIPGRVAAQRIDDLAQQVGLQHAIDRRVETYSRGMRQRLGIADALLKEPSVLILDEPTASLDPEGVAELLALIERIAAERQIAVLLSSHLLDQVQAICHRVGIFYEGRLIAEGPVRDLAAGTSRTTDEVEVGAIALDGSPVTFESLSAVLQAVAGVDSVVPDAENARLLVATGTPGIAGDLAAAVAAAGLRTVHLRTREERLDSIYRRLVHAAADEDAWSDDEPADDEPADDEPADDDVDDAPPSGVRGARGARRAADAAPAAAATASAPKTQTQTQPLSRRVYRAPRRPGADGSGSNSRGGDSGPQDGGRR